MENIAQQLQQKNVGDVRLNEPLQNHTTWKIGGPAELFVVPASLVGLQETMDIIAQEKLPWRVIGRGSNILVSDEGLKGVTIKLDKGMDELSIDGTIVRVGGGYPVIKLATVLSREGLQGFEFAGGIPGSVGGAVFMNAGAHGSDISQILTRAHVLFPNGKTKWLSNEELAFSYRTSLLQKDEGICIEAEFRLKKGNIQEIKEQLQKNKDYRRETQPWNFPTCGSVFRNPLPKYAGQLIEEAGLKGHTIGGAQISSMHGNFIVNIGEATAEDVLNLIDYVKQTIDDKYGVAIETEVEMIGKSKTQP